MPDVDAVGQDAYNATVAEEAAYEKLLKMRKNQIRNFLTYRLTRLVLKEGTILDPYISIKHKFFGVSMQKPWKRTAHNIWHRSNTEMVDAEAALALFKKLSPEDQEQFKALAEEEHIEDVEKWKEALKLKVFREPVDYQRAIEHAAPFVQPILNVFEDVTGWKWHLMGGVQNQRMVDASMY